MLELLGRVCSVCCCVFASSCPVTLSVLTFTLPYLSLSPFPPESDQSLSVMPFHFPPLILPDSILLITLCLSLSPALPFLPLFLPLLLRQNSRGTDPHPQGVHPSTPHPTPLKRTAGSSPPLPSLLPSSVTHPHPPSTSILWGQTPYQKVSVQSAPILPTHFLPPSPP